MLNVFVQRTFDKSCLLVTGMETASGNFVKCSSKVERYKKNVNTNPKCNGNGHGWRRFMKVQNSCKL